MFSRYCIFEAFSLPKKMASFRWTPAGFCPQFFQIEAHPRKHRPFLATLGATMTIPAKMQWFAHVGCIARAQIVTVIYFFLLPAAVATSVADTITRVTMDFHPQLGNLQISTLFDGKKLYGKKKRKQWRKTRVESKPFSRVFLAPAVWEQTHLLLRIIMQNLCGCESTWNTSTKTIGPNPNHTKPEYNPN